MVNNFSLKKLLNWLKKNFKMTKQNNYITSNKSSWCPGCSNFSIRAALIRAFSELNLKPHEISMVFDIGCAGNSCNLYKTYGFHGLHGRTVPLAVGAKLANNKLTVIGITGDGGAYGEGLNHFIEAARSDFDITLIVSNNRLYSLTTGQASPTSKKGTKTKSTPDGVKKTDLNPLLMALSAGAGFVSRGYANEVDYLSDIFKKAISHKGFSLVDVLQPCITLDKVNTKEWYQKRIYQLDDKWPVKDRNKAIIKVQEYGERIPLGIFFEEK